MLISKIVLAIGIASASVTISGPTFAFTIYSGATNYGSPNNTGSPPLFPPQNTPIAAGPGAVQARANFDAALGLPGSTITFEGLAPQNFYATNGSGTLNPSLTPGVTISVSGARSGNTTPPNGVVVQTTDNSALGFNTTPQGDEFLRISPDNNASTQNLVTFTFTQPLKNGFGFYLNDWGNASSSAQLSIAVNGSPLANSQFGRYDSDGSSTVRSLQFFGIKRSAPTDPLISSVVLRLTGGTPVDRFGIDDIRFAVRNVPVPPQILGVVLTAALSGWKLRRKAQSLNA